jgi:hypothetical protein
MRIAKKTGESSLYWKKKTSDRRLFTYETDNKRESFRLNPPEDQLITFRFSEKEHRVIDIGAGGLSFKNSNFSEGDSGLITFRLPGQGTTISTTLKIGRICEKGICHCNFTEIEEDAVEKIHQYLLTEQKNILRSKKWRQGNP